jgi:hypothetical protein
MLLQTFAPLFFLGLAWLMLVYPQSIVVFVAVVWWLRRRSLV